MTVVAPPARLLVVDDHPLVRAGMVNLLTAEPGLEVVGEAENGRDAVALCDRLRPDVVLMDVDMPHMDGLSATRAIRERHPAIRVVIVTIHENPDYLFEALRAGAAGYLLKGAPPAALRNALAKVVDGELPLNRDLATRLLRSLVHKPAEPARSDVEQAAMRELLATLTPRELEVLPLLAEGRTNREIADVLVVAPGTVKNHVQHIITKLGVTDRTQAAVVAARAGLLPAG